MRTIISEQQQVALLQKQGRERLNRKSLGKKLGLSAPTVRRILDDNAPVIVTGKVFTAVNDWLISELAKWQQKNSPAVAPVGLMVIQLPRIGVFKLTGEL